MLMALFFLVSFTLLCMLSSASPFALGAQSFGTGSMPGVQSVALVGQINLAHQPPSVSLEKIFEVRLKVHFIYVGV